VWCQMRKDATSAGDCWSLLQTGNLTAVHGPPFRGQTWQHNVNSRLYLPVMTCALVPWKAKPLMPTKPLPASAAAPMLQPCWRGISTPESAPAEDFAGCRLLAM